MPYILIHPRNINRDILFLFKPSLLSLLTLSFNNILKKSPLDEEKTKDTIINVITLLNDTIISTRELTADLYPTMLDDLGYIPAIKWHTETVMKPNEINTSLRIDDRVESLSTEVKLSLFRVIQESLHNIIKHASATEVLIELITLWSTLKLSVKDNGNGFDTDKIKEKIEKGIGFRLMKERAISIGGIFKLDSTIDKGTEIIIEIPVQT